MDRIASVEKCLPKDDLRCELSIWMFRIVQPLLVGIGTVGNILNILVLSRKAFRSKQILILIPLAVSDLIYLWATMSSSLLNWNISQSNHGQRELFSKITVQINFFARGCSNLVIAVFTVVRLYSILLPHTANARLSLKRTFKWLAMLVILCGIYTGFMVFGFQHFNPNGTRISPEDTSRNITGCYAASTDFGEYCFLVRIPYILLFLLVPLAISCLGNIALLIKLKCCRRLVATSGSQDSHTGILFAITGFLLATSALTVAIIILKETMGDQKTNTFILIATIVYIVQLSNYSVNFFLYLWKGKLFKDEFKQMCLDIKAFLWAKFGNVV